MEGLSSNISGQDQEAKGEMDRGEDEHEDIDVG